MPSSLLKTWQAGLILLVTLLATAGLRFDGLQRYWQQAHPQSTLFSQITGMPFWPPVDHLATVLNDSWQTGEQAFLLRSDLIGKVILQGHEAIAPVGLFAVTPCPELRPAALKVQQADASGPASENKPAEQASQPATIALTANSGGVLLAGDSMMQGVAPYVVRALKKDYGVDGVDISKQSTGLAYPKTFDWPQTIEHELASGKYSTLVLLIGANDTWDLSFNGKYEVFGTKNWKIAYAGRVQAILASARQHHTRVLWLSAPPMGREKMTDRVPILNQVFFEEVARAGSYASYLETGRVLTSDGKTYSKFLEVPQKGKVMVRTDDGVHFTPTGQKLLARLVLDQFTPPSPVESHS